MNWIKSIVLLGAMIASYGLHAQITIEAEPEKEEEEIMEIPIATPKENVTEVYGYANWSATNRKLIENNSGNGLFGDTLGERANELGLNIWSFGIGVRSELKGNWKWQGGISLIRNGETYDFQGVDTAFSYQTYYNYIAMPLKVLYSYGNRFSVYGGVGIVPQMFFSFREDQQWTNSVNTSGEETIKTRSGYNTFVVSASASVGFQMRMRNGIALFVEPEYRYQLNSTYVKTDKFQHFARAFGVNLGFTYAL